MGDKADMYLWAAFIVCPEISKLEEWTLYIKIKICTYSFQTTQHHSIAFKGMQICFSSVSWNAEVVHGLDTHRAS